MAKIKPKVSEVDGVLSPGRKQAVQVAQGLAAWIEWTIRDEDGNPVDLTTHGITSAGSSSSSGSSEAGGGTVKLRLIECLSLASSATPVEIAGEAVDAATGLVRAKLTSASVAKPGVYILEWSVYHPDGDLEVVHQGSMIVYRSLAGGAAENGPPTIAEIKLHIRDAGPEDNFLLDTVEFDLAEIAACIERPVQVWNETMSFVPRTYNTTTFPYRSRWVDACVGYLFQLAAHNYDRNLQQYQAGGTSMRDKDKGPLYTQKGQAMVQEYRQWVQTRKGQINLEAAYGSTSESY